MAFLSLLGIEEKIGGANYRAPAPPLALERQRDGRQLNKQDDAHQVKLDLNSTTHACALAPAGFKPKFSHAGPLLLLSPDP